MEDLGSLFLGVRVRVSCFLLAFYLSSIPGGCAALRAALHGSVRGLRATLRVALRLSWCVRHREQLVIGVLIGQFVSRVIWLIVIRFFKLV